MIPTIPKRGLSVRPTINQYRPGAKKEIARPVVAYNPKFSPACSTVDMWANAEREGDWTGPTRAAMTIPHTQNVAVAPEKTITTPLATIVVKHHTITRLGPKRSSTRPANHVETPATRLAANPK